MLTALVIIIGVVVWLFAAQPWRGAAADASPSMPSASPSPTATPTPSPTPAETEDPSATDVAVEPSTEPTPVETGIAKPCEAHELTVEALTDQDTYRSGQNPQLSIQLTNDGAKDCTINVGTTGQQFTITSGSDTWWRSTDCQTEPSDMVVTLAAGQTVTSATPLTWDRTRSNVSTCGDADRPRAPGGGASFHLTVEIGGVASMTSKQFLLY